MAFNTASSIGGFVGCLAMGYTADRFGRRLALGVACCVSSAAVFAQIFANQNGVLLLGKLLNGLSLGSFLTISSSYAAEVCSIKLRPCSITLFGQVGSTRWAQPGRYFYGPPGRNLQGISASSRRQSRGGAHLVGGVYSVGNSPERSRRQTERAVRIMVM